MNFDITQIRKEISRAAAEHRGNLAITMRLYTVREMFENAHAGTGDRVMLLETLLPAFIAEIATLISPPTSRPILPPPPIP